MLHQTDLQSSNQFQPVAKQQLERAGFKVELQAMDWQDRGVAPRPQGGAGEGRLEHLLHHQPHRRHRQPRHQQLRRRRRCEKAWFGWPCDPEIEKLRAAFIRETDPAKRKALGYAISDRVMEQGVYVPVGQYKASAPTARTASTAGCPARSPVVWNISKK